MAAEILTMPTIFERFQTILTSKFSVPAENIRPDSTIESFGLDSLDLIELLFEVEEQFNIRVPQDGAAAVKATTVQEMTDSIAQLVEAGGPQAGAQ